MLVGLPWNLAVRPMDAARSARTGRLAVAGAETAPAEPAAGPVKGQSTDLHLVPAPLAPELSKTPEQPSGQIREQLEREIRFTGKSDNGYSMGVGFTKGRTYVSTPPEKRATMAEAVADYGKYLDKIVHAEGRESSRPADGDAQSALECVGLEYNYLHREPKRVTLFEHLVGLLQNPHNALGVLQDLETVPEERRGQVLGEIEIGVRELRNRTRAPQNNVEALNEGTQLNMMSLRLSMAGRVARPDDNLGELAAQIADARKGLTPELKSDHLAAIEVAARYRQDGETLAQGVERFLPAFSTMRALIGQDVPTTLALLSQLPESDPEQLKDLSECGEYLRTMGELPADVAGPALQAAFGGYGQPLDNLRKSLRSFELTGAIDGLEQARDLIDDKLEAGQLIGTRDEWMARLEHRLEHLMLFEPDPKKAFARAQNELFEGAGGRLGEQNGYLVVGHSRLPVRLLK